MQPAPANKKICSGTETLPLYEDAKDFLIYICSLFVASRRLQDCESLMLIGRVFLCILDRSDCYVYFVLPEASVAEPVCF